MKDGQMLFNVLECVKHLRSVGFTQEQAEAQAQEIEKAKNDLESHLATKKDVAEIKRDIKELEERLGERFERIDQQFDRIGERFDLKLIIASGSFAFIVLSALVALAKLGLLAPAK